MVTVMRSIVSSLCVALFVLFLPACEDLTETPYQKQLRLDEERRTEQQAKQTALKAVLVQVASGQGVAETASFAGGSIPHLIAGLEASNHPKNPSTDIAQFHEEGVSSSWVCSDYAIATVQLVLIKTITYTPTGQTQLYTIGTGVMYHLSVSYQLRVAQTAEVLSSLILQGRYDGFFPASFSTSSMSSTYIFVDTVDYSPVAGWLDPYVNR